MVIVIDDPLFNFKNYDFKSLSSFLKNIPPYEFGLLGGVIGVIISIPLSSPELNSLGNFFQLISQAMLTIQAQMELTSPSFTAAEEFELLKKDIDNRYNSLVDLINKKYF